MGRAFRTGAVLGVISLGGLGLIGACSVEKPTAASLANGDEADSAPASSRADAAVDGSIVVVGDAGTGDADASDGGWAPPPPPCPTRTFIDEAVIARAAAALEACQSDDGFLRTTTYLRRVQDGFGYYSADAVACVASVTNGCAGVAACFGYSPFDGGETCGTCIGETAAYCPSSSNWRGLNACDKFAGTCDAGTCAYPQNPLCSGSTRCDPDGRPLHCGGGKPESRGPECPAFGLACGDNGFNAAKCSGLGTSCGPPTYFGSTGYFDIEVSSKLGNTCSGDILAGCVNGKRANLDCRCFGPGFSCQTAFTSPTADGGTYQTSFCGAASECNPRSYKFSCDGNTVVFCNAGKVARIDCNAMGFPGCSTTKPARGCLPDTFALPH